MTDLQVDGPMVRSTGRDGLIQFFCLSEAGSLEEKEKRKVGLFFFLILLLMIEGRGHYLHSSFLGNVLLVSVKFPAACLGGCCLLVWEGI